MRRRYRREARFDPNRAEYCISAMFDAAGKTGCNLLELQHALKSMKAAVDAELEVRMENAGRKTPGRIL